MTLNTAIKRAIEQGKYLKGKIRHVIYDDSLGVGIILKSQPSHAPYGFINQTVLLDAEFWQCLGVAMKDKRRWRRPIQVNEGLPPIPAWHFHWRLFIDALASGKTADEAMGEIIK